MYDDFFLFYRYIKYTLMNDYNFEFQYEQILKTLSVKFSVISHRY